MVGRRCYVLLSRRYNVPIRRRRDAPLRRLGDIPSRRRWVFHLRRTCDVTGTYRETSLRRRHDVLMPGGTVINYIVKVKVYLFIHGNMEVIIILISFVVSTYNTRSKKKSTDSLG